MQCVRSGWRSEDAFDRLRLGDVHRLELCAFEFGEHRLVRFVLADHHRHAAPEEIAHYGGADESGASCYEELHHASPSLAIA